MYISERCVTKLRPVSSAMDNLVGSSWIMTPVTRSRKALGILQYIVYPTQPATSLFVASVARKVHIANEIGIRRGSSLNRICQGCRYCSAIHITCRKPREFTQQVAYKFSSIREDESMRMCQRSCEETRPVVRHKDPGNPTKGLSPGSNICLPYMVTGYIPVSNIDGSAGL